MTFGFSFFRTLFIAFAGMFFFLGGVGTGGNFLLKADDALKSLPAPEKDGGMPLMQALNERKADRNMSPKALKEQVVSNLLWAAWGVNRDDGRRVIPTARNVQDLDVYILTKDGASLYVPEKHALKTITSGDMSAYLGKGSILLVYTADSEKNNKLGDAAVVCSYMHAGSAYQNAGLFCASAGLNNVVKLQFDEKGLRQALNLPASKKILITQSIGGRP